VVVLRYTIKGDHKNKWHVIIVHTA